MSLPGQLVGTFCLARLGVRYRLGGRARRDGNAEGSQEFGAVRTRLQDWVVRVAGERGDLVSTPDPKRHRGEDSLEVVAVVGREQAEAPPFAWLKRRAPQPEQVA